MSTASAQVMPKELRLSAPPTMPQARSYMFKVQSTNSSYDSAGSNSIQINIPRLQRSYLTKDSYLRFRMNLSSAFTAGVKSTDLLLDTPGAFGFFDKIEVYDYLGSTLLESTSGHGQLMATLLDMTSANDELGNHFNTTCGTSPGSINIADDTRPTTIRSFLTSSTPAFALGAGGVTTAQTGTGIDGVANSATVMTVGATAATSTLTATVTTLVPASPFSFSGVVWVKRTTGAGTLTVTPLSGTPGIFPVAATNNVWYPVTFFTTQSTNTPTIIITPGTPADVFVIDQMTLTTNNSALTSSFIGNQTASQNGYVLSKNASAATTLKWEFGIPLFSFLGGLGQKFTPLHNGFTIVLTMNTADKAFGAGSYDSSVLFDGTFPSAYTLSNLNLCCQVLELGPQAESMLLSSAGGKPLIVPTKAFRNYVTQIPASSSTFKMDLNLNVASLTNLLWIMREESPTALSLAYRDSKYLSSRCRNYLQNWYFQYGSSILPQTSGIQASSPPGVTITNGGHDEAYLELVKSRHALNSDSFDSMIDRTSYTIDTAISYGTGDPSLSQYNKNRRGTFAAGLDLELVSGRSQNLICGLNTNGMNTSIYGTFWNGSSQASGTKITRVDLWAEYDAFINISPGIATTVSF